MKNKRKPGPQLKIYLREGDELHEKLRKRCNERNRNKFKTVADYLAAAVNAFEPNDNVAFSINLNRFNNEVRDAVNVLMRYKNE